MSKYIKLIKISLLKLENLLGSKYTHGVGQWCLSGKNSSLHFSYRYEITDWSDAGQSQYQHFIVFMYLAKNITGMTELLLFRRSLQGTQFLHVIS